MTIYPVDSIGILFGLLSIGFVGDNLIFTCNGISIDYTAS